MKNKISVLLVIACLLSAAAFSQPLKKLSAYPDTANINAGSHMFGIQDMGGGVYKNYLFTMPFTATPLEVNLGFGNKGAVAIDSTSNVAIIADNSFQVIDSNGDEFLNIQPVGQYAFIGGGSNMQFFGNLGTAEITAANQLYMVDQYVDTLLNINGALTRFSIGGHNGSDGGLIINGATATDTLTGQLNMPVLATGVPSLLSQDGLGNITPTRIAVTGTVASIDATGRNGGSNPVFLVYAVPHGMAAAYTYNIGVWVRVTSVSGGILRMQVQWTDETGAGQLTTFAYLQTVAWPPNVSIGATGAYQYLAGPIRAHEGTNVTVSLPASGGAISYDAGAYIEVKE